MSHPRKVYVVRGQTGEYTDWTTWIVACYSTKEQADVHLNRLELKTTELKLDRNGIANRHDNWMAAHNQFEAAKKLVEQTLDPHVNGELSTGISYEVEEVEFFDHLDEFMEVYNKLGE